MYSFTSTPDKESNKYYLGPAPLEEMARWNFHFSCTDIVFLQSLYLWTVFNVFSITQLSRCRQIATASGPCGNNREYIFKLEKALFDIGKSHKFEKSRIWHDTCSLFWFIQILQYYSTINDVLTNNRPRGGLYYWACKWSQESPKKCQRAKGKENNFITPQVQTISISVEPTSRSCCHGLVVIPKSLLLESAYLFNKTSTMSRGGEFLFLAHISPCSTLSKFHHLLFGFGSTNCILYLNKPLKNRRDLLSTSSDAYPFWDSKHVIAFLSTCMNSTHSVRTDLFNWWRSSIRSWKIMNAGQNITLHIWICSWFFWHSFGVNMWFHILLFLWLLLTEA